MKSCHQLKQVLAVCVVVLFGFHSQAIAEVQLPDGTVIKNVDFEKHVVGLFGRSGCNLGSCHGSFQGKNGFRLSLFGYEADKDGVSVSREMNGRRIDLVQPDNSLLLLKGMGLIEHAGGRRFSPGSWQHKLIKAWIEQGAPLVKGSGEIKSLEVTPKEIPFHKPGEKIKLKAMVSFADGTTENITSLCEYRTLDDAVAEVDSTGNVTGNRAGDTSIIVAYRGTVVPVRAMVPLEVKPGYKYPSVPEVNYIDKIVFSKLKRLNIEPSSMSGDVEFLRRISIDVIGSLPTPNEIRTFVADKDPNKRSKKVDELLKHPLHAALWATKISDITGNNTDAMEQPQNLRAKKSQMWHDWLRKRVSENVSYDKIVEGVLCATSRDGDTPEEYILKVNKMDEEITKGFVDDYANKSSLDLFWRKQGVVTLDQWGEKTAAAFMGMRLECAQCHKHPFDRWTQVDYRSYANVFSQLAYGTSPEAKKAIDAENAERKKNAMGKNNNQINVVKEVYVANAVAGKGGAGKALVHPETNLPLAPKALGGPEIKMETGVDARRKLFEWLKSPDNPYFARSFVNRVWGHYFGVGIVDPLDDFSIANPPSNPQLLDALAKDFIDSGFDIRKLEKTILLSRVYNLTSVPNETNRFDDNNYSHSFIRPMMAEVVVDVLCAATGMAENFGPDARKDSKAIEVGASRVNSSISYAFRIFGRPPRTAACDCERSMEPALPQKLYLMADTNLQAKIESQGNIIKKILAENQDDQKALEELFLSTLSRFPNDRDKKHFEEYRAKSADRKTAFVDTLWALLNTKEFIFNH